MRNRIGKTMALTASVALAAFLQAEASATRYGLFVGVDEYSLPECDDLFGCGWDAMRMMDSYTRGGLCPADNAELVADLDATKESVRAKFQALASRARPGDTVLYYQSGHGGTYNDDRGSTLCMTDDEWKDTEFAEDLARFADGVRVVVVLDACYSGGMFKSAGTGGGRGGRWDFAARAQRRLAAKRAAKSPGAGGAPSVGWITAAEWNEEAWTDDRGSEFTHAVLEGWADARADVDGDDCVSFGELAEYAKDAVEGSSVQSGNEALLAATRAGSAYDVATFRLLSANGTLYGFLGECPASLEVPAGTTAIAASAFDADYNGSRGLEAVSFPESLLSIGDYAFYGCQNLASGASGASGLRGVDIPAGVYYVGDGAFAYCESLAEVVFRGDDGEIDMDVFSAFEGTPWLATAYSSTLTFETGGGTEIEPITQLVGTEVPVPDDPEKPGYAFCGWSPELPGTMPPEDMTLHAVWMRNPLWKPVGRGASGTGDAAFTGETSERYDGYLLDADGRLGGTVQVKLAKAKIDRATRRPASKAKAAVRLADGGKSVVNGIVDLATGVFKAADGAGRVLEVRLGANGLSGTFGQYAVDGAQDKFASRDAGVKAVADDALDEWRGAWSVAWPDQSGWSGVSLTVADGGKVKIAGVLADGTKVKALGRLLVGEGNVCAIPVVVAKNARLAFNAWLADGGVQVVGLPDGAVAGKVGELGDGAAFRIDADAFAAMWGKAPLQYLPDGEGVAQKGAKWVVAGGARAGKVVVAKATGEIDESKLGENPSGLKLAFAAKTGIFRGSFKAYVMEDGKPKATTVGVSGVMVGGEGYGTASVKNAGSVPVAVW